MSEFRKRILMPAALPLMAAGFVGVLALSFASVMLAVPEIGSTTLALLMSAMILTVAGVLASTGSRLKKSQKMLAGLAMVALIGAGIGGAAMGVREVHPHAEQVHVAAENIAFAPDALHFPVGEPVDLVFENRDSGISHDVVIFPDDTFTPGTEVFDGEVFEGVATATYSVPPLDEGIYAFWCSVHPIQMRATLFVGEDGEPGEGPTDGDQAGPEPQPEPRETQSPEPPATEPGALPASAEITAEDLAFNVDRLELASGTSVTLTLDNRDNVLHNVEIYPDDSFTGEPLFRGETFAGPEARDYTIPPIPAGTYAYWCVVHPGPMRGTVVFG